MQIWKYIIFLVFLADILHAQTAPIDRIIISRDPGARSSANTQLTAPYFVKFDKPGFVSIDLGGSSDHPLDITILDKNRGVIYGHFLKCVTMFANPCPDIKIRYYVGVYTCEGASSPFIAIPGKLSLTAIEWLRADTTLPNQEIKTKYFQNQKEILDVIYKNITIARVISDYGDASFSNRLKFKYNGKTFYGFSANVKLDIAIGLLFHNGSTWECMYRTTDPSERRIICD